MSDNTVRSGPKRPRILQINYHLAGTAAQYIEENRPYAQPIADTPGLLWKVWLLNEAKQEAGGIYLFESDDALQAFLRGPIAEEVRTDPTSSFKDFDVPIELSKVTRAPLMPG